MLTKEQFKELIKESFLQISADLKDNPDDFLHLTKDDRDIIEEYAYYTDLFLDHLRQVFNG